MSRIQGNARRLVSNTVETLTGKFFPGVSFSQLGDSSFGNEVVSSLPLQMVIYFSALFFPCWFITSLVMMILKFQHMSNVYQFVLVAIYVAVPLIEVIRLYIGHVGNLEEKVPELAGSWLLSLLLQLPLLLFLVLVPGTWPLPMDYAINCIFLFFVILHLIFGYRAIKITAAHQARLYHMYLVMRQMQDEE
ncbi:transmembrane protein 17-like [Homarus americanus]|uniref:transmembrane protein 17-like n=1 Tax=Homarus americanus TaxID=6706 RepID=UPI001C467C22|nr:transmembrane protein 17-like [Homarus americanus]XP_042209812.1 transmembrane protein 17-like [Homarus americanus]XP_042209813.1 transmembrane protein 17-like [Homarus americanus]XP_042209814.1 transmembrane protein 17-like [Homarus americanus]